MQLESWGRFPKTTAAPVFALSRHDTLPDVAGTLLAYGKGRSYGDSCLNDGGTLVCTSGMDRLLELDHESGLLRCEAGVTLAQILDVVVDKGWFLPVVPGTKFVTVGGAIANDIHGKNHHVAGTFGCHVQRFELLRSDGTRHLCSPTENAALFAATIGGLGLTGLVTWAEIKLARIHNPWIVNQTTRLKNLDAFFDATEKLKDQPYSVAWIDSLATGRSLGKGHFYAGHHAGPEVTRGPKRRALTVAVPVDAPGFVLNKASIKAFNVVWDAKGRNGTVVQHYEPYFFPLDFVHGWNKMYGDRGFVQHQCVVPATAKDAIARLLETVATSGTGSFLTVLKAFGDVQSPGMLSFPRPGITLALDLPGSDERTLSLCQKLDEIVESVGGALYAAKDARMSPDMFRRSYPRLDAFCAHVDPKFSSSLWRRVMGA